MPYLSIDPLYHFKSTGKVMKGMTIAVQPAKFWWVWKRGNSVRDNVIVEHAIIYWSNVTKIAKKLGYVRNQVKSAHNPT